MIVDDDEVSNYIFGKLIGIAGFWKNIFHFEQAEKALAYIKENVNRPENLPDVLFLDIVLRDMTGWEFLEKFETLPAGVKNKIYIVILTNSIFEKDRQLSGKYPSVKRYLTKPITLESLNEIRGEINNK